MLATGCAYALMYVRFVHPALGNEGGGVQLVYEGTCCLVWGIIFYRRKDRGVVCVFSIFDAGGIVCGCMCVYTHTHTHKTRMGYSDVSPGVGMRPGGPKESRCTKSQHVCLHVCVQSTHMYVYARRRDEILN